MTIVRLANAADETAADALAAAAFAALRAVYQPTAKARVNAAQLSETAQSLVAIANGHIVGTVKLVIEGDALRLFALAVAPEFRRTGVARALIDASVEHARSSLCRTLSLHTVRETGNVPIFGRLGFHVASECVDEYSEGPHGEPRIGVSMQKRVHPDPEAESHDPA